LIEAFGSVCFGGLRILNLVAIWWTLSGFALPLFIGFWSGKRSPNSTRTPVKLGVFAALIGVFEISVKTAFLDWEAAVLPLNYARKILI
jgi:hypothetical protein